jgi:hypothetical protein
MRSRTRCLALATVVLVAASLLAAGCTGSVVSGPAPIRIGALVPVTGLGLSNYLAAFRAAVRSINAHGGVRGRPVLLENCDDQNDANLAQSCARQLASDYVIATASDASGFSMVEGPILDNMGIPQVGNAPLNPEDSTLPTSFPITGGPLAQVAGGIVGMKRRGLQSLFVAASDSPSGHNTVMLADKVTKAGQVSLSSTFVPVSAADLSAYIKAAMQSKAEVVFPALTPAQTIQFVKTSKAAGASYTIMVPYGQFSPRDILAMGGPGALTENDIEFSAVPPLSAADQFSAIKLFTADMDAELAAGDMDAAADLRSGGSLSAWLSVQIIFKLASTLGTINASTIWAALLTYPSVDTLGLTPTWIPSKSGPSGSARLTNLNGYLVTQHRGQEVLDGDGKPLNPLQVLGM